MKSSERFLIVNADDFNLTPGVSKAILECHDQGVVTSTTVLINRSDDSCLVQPLLKRKNLGIGLHLNITLGKPIMLGRKVASLLAEEGHFRKCLEQVRKFPKKKEVYAEWEAQIRLFKKTFSKLPTHLDTHHQIHDHPFYYRILTELAKNCRLPFRRSKVMKIAHPLFNPPHLWGDLDPGRYWKKTMLIEQIKKLPPGIHEIMCHPGYSDFDLKKISSFTEGREAERKIFASPELRQWVKARGVKLTHYGLCYT